MFNSYFISQVEKDATWTTATWPRNKKANLSEQKSGTLGRNGMFGKGSCASLGRGDKLNRKPSLGKRMRVSARNWAASKGIIDPSKETKPQTTSEASTKPSSIVLGENEAKPVVDDEKIEKIQKDVVEVSAVTTDTDIGLVVKELVTEAMLKKSRDKLNEIEHEVEAVVEEIPVKEVIDDIIQAC